MNASARSRILQRLRRAQAPSNSRASKYLHTGNTFFKKDSRDLRALLEERFEGNRTQVITCTQATLIPALAGLLTQKQWRQVMVGSQAPLSAPSLRASLIDCELHQYHHSFEDVRDQLFDATDAAITGVHAALADTGTLVLLPDANEPRTLSLVPPVHIAILTRACPIYANFHSLMADAPWDTRNMPSNIVFVCGPSKTADIQQTLAYGAHGPKELIVFMVSD